MATLTSRQRVTLGGARGVALAPGKPVKVDDSRVDALLRYGNGTGNRLVKAGLLHVELDSTTADRARRDRVEDAAESMFRTAEKLDALPADELSDAHALLEQLVKMRRPDLREDEEGEDEEGDEGAGPAGLLTPEILAKTTIAHLAPMIAEITDIKTIEAIANAETAGANRKGVHDLLEARWTELQEPAGGEGG